MGLFETKKVDMVKYEAGLLPVNEYNTDVSEVIINGEIYRCISENTIIHCKHLLVYTDKGINIVVGTFDKHMDTILRDIMGHSNKYHIIDVA